MHVPHDQTFILVKPGDHAEGSGPPTQMVFAVLVALCCQMLLIDSPQASKRLLCEHVMVCFVMPDLDEAFAFIRCQIKRAFQHFITEYCGCSLKQTQVFKGCVESVFQI